MALPKMTAYWLADDLDYLHGTYKPCDICGQDIGDLWTDEHRSACLQEKYLTRAELFVVQDPYKCDVCHRTDFHVAGDWRPHVARCRHAQHQKLKAALVLPKPSDIISPFDDPQNVQVDFGGGEIRTFKL